MSAIKKFFQKKKLDVKFKKAGEGHRLTDETKVQGQTPNSQQKLMSPRSGPSASAQRAGSAALDRITQPKPGTSSGVSSIRAQARKELEAEKFAMQQSQVITDAPKAVDQEAAPVLAASGVFFKCPIAGSAVLPRKEMELYIEEFLLNQLGDEPVMASALMIYTFNKDAEKIKICVETLCKYLDNIITQPEEKFRKIRIGNKAFQDRVACLKGTEEFLQAVGFTQRKLNHQGEEEPFYIMDEDAATETDHLLEVKDIILDAEPIRPELDRGLKVFYPTKKDSQFEIHPDLYNITPEEIKREQQARTEAVEKLGMLRTKAMRERDEQRELRRYKYTLVRIRFPNGIILQGIFKAFEKLSCLMDFLRENLVNDWQPFILSTSTGHKLTEEDDRLAQLGLVPAVVINFTWDPTVMAEIAAQKGTAHTDYLKPEVMAQIQAL